MSSTTRAPADLTHQHLRQAEALLEKRDVDAAIAAFTAAESSGADPDRCAAGRWSAQMLAGNFAGAWAESDAIRARGNPDPNCFWNGEDLAGKRVILRCLHGFGDAVQLLRYVPGLRALTSALVIEVPPAMVEIAHCFEGVDRVITWGVDAPATPYPWDVQVEITELPYLFRTEFHQLPLATNYLRVPVQTLPSATAKVGIVWAAGEWNPDRSIPLDLLEPLLRSAGCEFWNLQGGRARQDWQALTASPNRVDARASTEGILPLARTIAEVDLVITVDTLAAHLAGAMGKPCWVLLQYAADWRWKIGQNCSVWYPSLRLFRQPVPGDWKAAVHAAQQALANWLRQTA